MLVTDLKSIKDLSQEKQGENFLFKKFLKTHSSKNIDDAVFKLNDEVSANIDCTQCANCCKTLQPAVTDAEAKVLSQEKKIATKLFYKDFLETDELEKINYFKIQPCIFLTENKCSCYEKRPASCAEYPHLNKPNFKYRMPGIMINYESCPIVFNVVEKLKIELGFLNQQKA